MQMDLQSSDSLILFFAAKYQLLDETSPHGGEVSIRSQRHKLCLPPVQLTIRILPLSTKSLIEERIILL